MFFQKVQRSIIAPPPQKPYSPPYQDTSEETSTKYRKACYPSIGCGKYTLFSFEYPYGWHVRYFLTLTADSPEGGLEISSNPLAGSDCPETILGTAVSKSKEELNETTFGEFAEEQNRKNEETGDRNFRKESFSLQEGLSGFCYSYLYADHMCGFRDAVDCYVDFEKAGERMNFMLNNYDYFEEFKHFVESIQPSQ